ncbi:hypothetical protein EDD11_009415 [Mortierella claussenii]|nr:hypothetical protein EDD11_009415 [Mortierella claussenii]
MGASLIATAITFDTLLGALLVGASFILTLHSLARMVFLKRTASKYHLFPIINVAQLVNEFCVFFLITTAFDTISFHTALWLNVINNVAYFITKPTTMYLAYLRCSAVYPAFGRADWLHFFLIGFRAVELFAIVVVNIIQNQLCEGSVEKGTRCAGLAIAWTIRDAGAPVFRFYYILCEAIFYYKLFATLKGMSQGKNVELMQYRRLQTSLFTVDLILLFFMSIYRIIGIFNTHLPTYVYYELFSSTLSIFALTEFGLNIRMLFNTVSTERGTSDAASNGGPHGLNGSNFSKLELGSVTASSNRPRPLSSPLASNAAGFNNGSEFNIETSPLHQDYVGYSGSASNAPPQNILLRDPYSSSHPSTRFYDDYDHSLSSPYQEKSEPIVHRPSLTYSLPERIPAIPDRAIAVPVRSAARRRPEDSPNYNS